MAHALEKLERVLEAVRQGLEGEASVDFVRQSGYGMTSSGITRLLRKVGGRGRVQELIAEGKTNAEIIQHYHPDHDIHKLLGPGKPQQELFEPDENGGGATPPEQRPLYETRKMTLHIPAELYEAVRAAAQGERKSQNQVIVDILTHALARMAPPVQGEFAEGDD